MSEATTSPNGPPSFVRQRQQPPPHLEAIQAPKGVQANVAFRPNSIADTTPTYPTSSFLSSTEQQQQQQCGSGEGVIVAGRVETTNDTGRASLPEPRPLMSAVTTTTSATGSENFPFTPSIIIAAVDIPSPVEQAYPTEESKEPRNHSNAYTAASVEGTRERKSCALISNSASPDDRHRRQSAVVGQQQQRVHPLRSSNDSRASYTFVQGGHGHGHDYGHDNDWQKRISEGQDGSGRMELRYSTLCPDDRQQQQRGGGLDGVDEKAQEERLPSLWQVLHRKTLPPVCLFNFYLYMRDVEKSAEEVDFWLDVTAHELLWRLYVRATKRRMALERIERERKEAAERAERERREREEQNPSPFLSIHGKHQHKPSVTADMYEPHLSAANRFLELSDAGSSAAYLHSDNDNDGEDDNGDDSGDGKVMRTMHRKESSEPMLMKSAPSSQMTSPPISPVSPIVASVLQSRAGEVPYLPGAVPTNWGRRVGEDNLERTDSQGAGSGDGNDGGGSTVAMMPRTLGSSGGPRKTSKRLTLSGASGGVTKEDVQKSAEMIYSKYLILQAEKRVRVPEHIKQRVAAVMDEWMMLTAMGDTPRDIHCQYQGTKENKNESMTVVRERQGMSLGPTSKGGRIRTDPGHSVRQSRNSHALSMESGPGELYQPEQELGLVFSEAREIVFEGMESYYFPRFLKARAYGNMVRSHRVMRAVAGLGMVFVGFVVVLCMIFLDLRPRSIRAWALIPTFVGTLQCATFQFNLCPVMVAFGVSETRWMQFARIEESYILMLHRERAVRVVLVAVLYTVCVGAVFGLVPGHRL
ncbi:Bud site selection protein, Revert to axial protein 1 [Gamsiella multidivaricata]|nr:Bud site selection protein, Revert to axial protein 1 [Gamsiella multidivaricata]